MTKPTGRPVGRPRNPPKPKAPARPRGRPPGVKNKPNSIGAFIQKAFSDPIRPAEIPPKPKGKPGSVWANRTPEERSAYARELALKRRPDQCKGGTPLGVPAHLTVAEFDSIVAQAAPEAQRIIKIMKKTGELPEMDPRAEAAMAALLTMLNSQNTTKDKTAIAKTILDFTLAKPASKTEVTMKSAEDVLDELADLILEPEPEDDTPEE